MRESPRLQKLVRFLVEYRLLFSVGLSLACGIVLHTLYPARIDDPLLRLIAYEQPTTFRVMVQGYNLFLYTTPFLFFSLMFSLAYIHLYRKDSELALGILPPYSDPRMRRKLSLVVGEVHRQLVPSPGPFPYWLTIPERGLYTGIACFGSIGSGKTYGLILPAMRQLFAYRADDPERKLSGIVLEVKGDLCPQL